jgi:hypothetical protein
MTLKTDINSDLSVFFNNDEFAEEVLYTPKGKKLIDAVYIYAVISQDGDVQEPYVRGEETATCIIEVKASDVSTPQHGDTFTFNDEIWEFDPVRGVIKKDDYTLIIALEREMS